MFEEEEETYFNESFDSDVNTENDSTPYKPKHQNGELLQVN